MKVLLGVSGSVAAKLNEKLRDSLYKEGHELRTIYTQSSLHFTYKNLYDGYEDEDEWKYYEKENRVLHIDLVKWADVLVVAPCTANTLSKIHSGICDNLLTCCVRAWPEGKKKIILAPAMNTEMWMKPHIQNQYESLIWRYDWIPPVSKTLFCGDTGIGAMASIEDIVKAI